MSKWLLDTNIPSEMMSARPESLVMNWVNAQPRLHLYLSVITIGELRKGAALLAPGSRRFYLETWLNLYLPVWFGSRILPVTQPIAERWGEIEVIRKRAGRPLSPTDGLIAATAIEHHLNLVTRNTKDFEGLGLELFNPWLPAGFDEQNLTNAP